MHRGNQMLLCAAILAAGCGGAARHFPRVANRASFDLGCEVSERDVRVVGGREFGVEACGCRAVYLLVNGQYVLNMVAGESCHVTAGGEGR